MKLIHNYFQLPNKTKVTDYGEAIVALYKGDINDCAKFKRLVESSYRGTVIYRGTEYQTKIKTLFYEKLDDDDYLVGFMADLIEVNHNEDMDKT